MWDEVLEHGPNVSGSGKAPVAGFCKKNNEHFGPTRQGECLNSQSDYCVFRSSFEYKITGHIPSVNFLSV